MSNLLYTLAVILVVFGQSVSSPLVPVESYMYYLLLQLHIITINQGKDYKISILVKLKKKHENR
jgi:hypothetical protein